MNENKKQDQMIRTQNDFDHIKYELYQFVEKLIHKYQERHNGSMKIIENFEEMLRKIAEKHIAVLKHSKTNIQRNEAVYNPNIELNHDDLFREIEDLKKYIYQLEFKLRKRKMKIKSLKDNLKEQTIKKYTEIESKLSDLFDIHQEQDRELYILKDKMHDRNNNIDIEKILKLGQNLISNNMSHYHQNQQPQNHQDRQNDFQNLDAINFKLPEKSPQGLFEISMNKDAFSFDKSDKSKIGIKREPIENNNNNTYHNNNGDKPIDLNFKILNKPRIRSRSRSRSISQGRTTVKIDNNLARKEFHISIPSEETETGQQNQDELSWINDELKRSNDDFLLFQDQLTKMAQEKLILMNENREKDEYIKVMMSRIEALNEKMAEIKKQLSHFENNHTNEECCCTSRVHINQVKTLQEENKKLRETIEILKSTTNISSSANKKFYRLLSDKLKSMPEDIEQEQDRSFYMYNDDPLIFNLSKTFDNINDCDGNQQPNYSENNEDNKEANTNAQSIKKISIMDQLYTNDSEQKDPKGNNNTGKKDKMLSTSTDRDRYDFLSKKIISSSKITDRLLDILSDYATGAYETLKLIASDKRKEVAKNIKDIMMSMQNFSNSFKKNNKKLLKNKELLTLDTIYDNFEEAIIKLLNYHDDLKNLKSIYYKHDDTKNPIKDDGVNESNDKNKHLKTKSKTIANT